MFGFGHEGLSLDDESVRPCFSLDSSARSRTGIRDIWLFVYVVRF